MRTVTIGRTFPRAYPTSKNYAFCFRLSTFQMIVTASVQFPSVSDLMLFTNRPTTLELSFPGKSILSGY